MKDEVRAWLVKAFEDYKVIKHEMSFPEGEIVTSAVCFHCQQFVEKLFKAYLVSRMVKFGKTHDLDYLKELCKAQDEEFEVIDLGDLNMYAVEVRYPDSFYIPSLEEARDCVRVAERVKEFVLNKLGLKEEDWVKG